MKRESVMVDRLRVACLVSVSAALGTCTCTGDARDRRIAAIERAIATNLEPVFGPARVSCPGGDPQTGLSCTGEATGRPPFAIDVTGVDADGAPMWKPRGKAKFEYEIARGFADRIGTMPAILCPNGGDLAVGFDCQLALPDGFTTSVSVSAAQQPDRFSWTAKQILMLAPIEAHIARDLQSASRAATVDCGDELHKSIAGHAFDCSVQFRDGGETTAVVTVVDAEGHVSYRLKPQPRQDAGPE